MNSVPINGHKSLSLADTVLLSRGFPQVDRLSGKIAIFIKKQISGIIQPDKTFMVAQVVLRSIALSSDPVSEFVTVARVGEIPDGQGQAFTVGDRMIAVFNDSGTYFAIDDFCPHMGASLAGGYMEDGAVACPWHAWRFSIRDGSWLDNPKIRVDSFLVRVVGDEIQVSPKKRDTTT